MKLISWENPVDTSDVVQVTLTQLEIKELNKALEIERKKCTDKMVEWTNKYSDLYYLVTTKKAVGHSDIVSCDCFLCGVSGELQTAKLVADFWCDRMEFLANIRLKLLASL